MCRVHDATGYHFTAIDGLTGAVSNLVDEPAGVGHPTVSPDGRWLVTDATDDSGVRRWVSMRLVDLVRGRWEDVCRVSSPAARGEDAPLRRDAHGAWDRGGRRFLFVGAPTGGRRLFVAEPGLPAGERMELG